MIQLPVILAVAARLVVGAAPAAAQARDSVSQQIKVLLADLLFVEMWLDLLLNSGRAMSGLSPDQVKVYRSALNELASDQGNLHAFVRVVSPMRNAASGQPAIESLITALESRAPDAAALLRELVSGKEVRA